MSLSIDRDELKSSLARIATPKAMVTKVYDAKLQKFGKSSVKVVCVDSDKLDTIRYSDAWVGADDDVQVGETHTIRIDSITEVTPVMEAKTLVIDKIMQIHCESTEELNAWVTGLSVLKKVCEIEGSSSQEESLANKSQSDTTTVVHPKGPNTQAGGVISADSESQKQAPNASSTPKHSDYMNQAMPTAAQSHADSNGNGTQTYQSQNLNLIISQMKQSLAEKDIKIDQLERNLDAQEELCEEKNETIDTLSKRLEHSLRMLKAVHSMYEQQQKVLCAQEAVIKEMDGANQAIQSAAGQMKTLLTHSKTPTNAGRRSAPTTPGYNSNVQRRQQQLNQLLSGQSNAGQTQPQPAAAAGVTGTGGLYPSRAAYLAAMANAEAAGKPFPGPAQNQNSSMSMNFNQTMPNLPMSNSSTNVNDRSLNSVSQAISTTGRTPTNQVQQQMTAATVQPSTGIGNTNAKTNNTSAQHYLAQELAKLKGIASELTNYNTAGAMTANASNGYKGLTPTNTNVSAAANRNTHLSNTSNTDSMNQNQNPMPMTTTADQNSIKTSDTKSNAIDSDSTNGNFSSSAMQDINEAQGLMKKIHDMRSLLESMTKGGCLETTQQSSQSQSQDVNMGIAAPKPGKDDSDLDKMTTQELLQQLAGDKNLLSSLTSAESQTGDEEDPGKLSDYVKNLNALETEKKQMEQQLADAQQQQSDMINRLEEMKNMASMFGKMGVMS